MSRRRLPGELKDFTHLFGLDTPQDEKADNRQHNG